MKEKTKNTLIGSIDALFAAACVMLTNYERFQQGVSMTDARYLLPLAGAIVFAYFAIQRIPQWFALMGFMAIGLFLVWSIGQPDKTPVVLATIVFICSFITYMRKDDDGEEETSDDKGENNAL